MKNKSKNIEKPMNKKNASEEKISFSFSQAMTFFNSNRCIYAVAGFLFLLYIFSFFKNDSMGSTRIKTFKSAFVNNKYIEDINHFELSLNGEELDFIKIKNIWFIYLAGKNELEQKAEDFFMDEKNLLFPADNSKVKNFLENLTNVRNVYKLSDRLSKDSSYGFDEDEIFTLNYSTSDFSSQIFFGNPDFSENFRYFMNSKNGAVYQTDNSISSYLSTSKQSWSEPYIVSKEITKGKSEKDVQRIRFFDYEKTVDFAENDTSLTQKSSKNKILNADSESFYEITHKLLELRQTGFLLDSKSQQILNEIFLDYGDKSFVKLTIFSTQTENEYGVKTDYYNHNELAFTTKCKISLWTYNKIKEMML
ncbi:MAG: DUF4340 domain-containing protein [Treponema sp.]|nr:DUF4340 domain-containing protein [Treponema sp.]